MTKTNTKNDKKTMTKNDKMTKMTKTFKHDQKMTTPNVKKWQNGSATENNLLQNSTMWPYGPDYRLSTVGGLRS